MPGAETKRASPSKPSPIKASPSKNPPVDDRQPPDDDYYHYYLASQRRVSKWINQTKKEMHLETMSEKSGVDDEYPASNLEFGTVTGSKAGSAAETSTVSRSTMPTTVMTRGEGDPKSKGKSKERSPTKEKLRERESRKKSKSRNGTTDEEEKYETATAEVKSQASSDLTETTTANTALPPKQQLKTRKSSKTPFKLDLDDASTVVAYPDLRTRTVVDVNEPTFTEVMGRLGTQHAAFGSEPSLATGITRTTRITERTGRTERTRSKSKRSSSEPPPEFEMSWSLIQPVLLILSSSTLAVVLIPSAAVAIVVVALVAIAYCLDLIPDLSQSTSRRKSSSDRHRSSRSSRR